MPANLRQFDAGWARRYLAARGIRAYNPNHDDRGRFSSGSGGAGAKSKTAKPSKKSKTPKVHKRSAQSASKAPAKESGGAANFGNNSVVKDTLYHGTSRDVAEKIREGGFKAGRSAFGSGVYLAREKGMADAYQRGIGKGETIETKIDVSKLLKITDSPMGYDRAAKQLGMSKKSFERRVKDHMARNNSTPLSSRGEVLREEAEKRGFHGFDVKAPSPFVVVFDPKRVAVLPKKVAAHRLTPIHAYNPNHDQAGRFAEGPGEGGGASGGSHEPAASPHHALYQNAKKVYESDKRALRNSKAAFQEARKLALGSAREARDKELKNAVDHHTSIHDSINEIASVHGGVDDLRDKAIDKANQKFANWYDQLESHTSEHDPENEPLSERYRHFSKTEKIATKGLALLSKIAPVENSNKHLSAKEIADNRSHIGKIIDQARAGKAAIKNAVEHVRLGKSIKTPDDDVRASNPNHDDRGRFAESAGGGGAEPKKPGIVKRTLDRIKQAVGLGDKPQRTPPADAPLADKISYNLSNVANRMGPRGFPIVKVDGKEYAVKNGETKERGDREALGADLGREIGLNIAKTTLIKHGSKEKAAVEWHEGAKSVAQLADEGKAAEALAKVPREEVDRHALFDYLIGNKDPNSGNTIFTPDGQMVGIDKEFSLYDEHGADATTKHLPEHLAHLTDTGFTQDYTFSKSSVEGMIKDGEKVASSLERRGDKAAQGVRDRLSILRRFSTQDDLSVRNLENLGAMGPRK